MTIAVMNHVTLDVTLISYAPDNWQEEEIREYLFTEKGLNLRENEVCYIAGGINFEGKRYWPKD